MSETREIVPFMVWYTDGRGTKQPCKVNVPEAIVRRGTVKRWVHKHLKQMKIKFRHFEIRNHAAL